jgi:hypothetical protein
MRKLTRRFIMNAPDDKQDTVQSTAYDPFPEPQTIPAGWDLSGLMSMPPVIPGMDEDDSTESQRQ